MLDISIKPFKQTPMGKFVNPLHFMHRIARISSSTIRSVNNAILTKITLREFMKRLVDKLILRPILI